MGAVEVVREHTEERRRAILQLAGHSGRMGVVWMSRAAGAGIMQRGRRTDTRSPGVPAGRPHQRGRSRAARREEDAGPIETWFVPDVPNAVSLT
jgi:hypothetical protein